MYCQAGAGGKTPSYTYGQTCFPALLGNVQNRPSREDDNPIMSHSDLSPPGPQVSGRLASSQTSAYENMTSHLWAEGQRAWDEAASALIETLQHEMSAAGRWGELREEHDFIIMSTYCSAWHTL